MGIPDHLTCLLRNLYTGQEATVRILYGTTDWFKSKKGVQQGYLLSPCLFNLYTEHIMRNAGLDELQAGVEIGWRNINNLRYADDTTLMAESKGELKSLSMRVKEESERAGLRLNFFFFLIFLFLFLYKFIYFNWMLITLQYCIGFAIHEHESAMGVHMGLQRQI